MFLSIYKSKTFEALFHATHKKFVLIQSMCFGVMCFGVHVFRSPCVSESICFGVMCFGVMCFRSPCVFGVHVFSESMCFRSPCVFCESHIPTPTSRVCCASHCWTTFPLRLRVFVRPPSQTVKQKSTTSNGEIRILRRQKTDVSPTYEALLKNRYFFGVYHLYFHTLQLLFLHDLFLRYVSLEMEID